MWTFWPSYSTLLDTAEVPLQFPICSSLRDIVNLLASGHIPVPVSQYLAGGCLTALVKNKPQYPPDIHPIAVGELSLTSPGREMSLCNGKVIHGFRHCVEEHWTDEDFTVLMFDMRDGFNLVSRQALLDECATHFPELLPWASWCYGQFCCNTL